jgi:uroporphyrinogen-III decarboxylase
MLTKELALKLLTLVNSEQWQSLEEYLNKVQEQTTQEMAKSQNLQIIHQCQGRWNFLERLKNLPNQVNELKKSVDE